MLTVYALYNGSSEVEARSHVIKRNSGLGDSAKSGIRTRYVMYFKVL